jgi:hypothetical protein
MMLTWTMSARSFNWADTLDLILAARWKLSSAPFKYLHCHWFQRKESWANFGQYTTSPIHRVPQYRCLSTQKSIIHTIPQHWPLSTQALMRTIIHVPGGLLKLYPWSFPICPLDPRPLCVSWQQRIAQFQHITPQPCQLHEDFRTFQLADPVSCTVTSGDFPARIRRSWAIIRSLLERTAEPAQAEPDTSSAGRSLERQSPSVYRRSRPESFGLRFNTFCSSLFMFPLIPLFISLFLLLIPSHLSSLVLS